MSMNQRGASPRRKEVWLFVAEGDCVAVRRGGEQPEANDSSVTQVNSIRPVALASLLASGEAQVTTVTSREEWRWKISPSDHAVKPGSKKTQTCDREGQGWLETEGSEDSWDKQGDLPRQGITT